MKPSDLKTIKQCATDMILFLLMMCFACIELFAIFQNIYLWLGALYMVFVAFFKALAIADLELKLNEY